VTRPFFCGNWKLFGTLADAKKLALGVRDATAAVTAADVAVAPGFVALPAVAAALEGGSLALAAQDCYWEKSGAFTGEVSALQIAEIGCRYAIVGHSERRQLFGDTDADVAKKAGAALAAGLVPIVCVGETLAERDAGQTLSRVAAQVDAAIAPMSTSDLSRCVIAYEPVWAIGTGRVATPAQAVEVHGLVRKRLAARLGAGAEAVRILYGGSVRPDNVAALMSQPDIDGALVGGASLGVDSFATIVKEGTTAWSTRS
jgi:triosephosphate isomerase